MGVGVTHDVALDRKQGRRTGRPLGYRGKAINVSKVNNCVK